MALIDDVKLDLSITGTTFDAKITSLIAEAKAKIQISGILTSKIIDTDPLIQSAIILYCHYRFAVDTKESERYFNNFTDIVTHLALVEEYNTEEVTA